MKPGTGVKIIAGVRSRRHKDIKDKSKKTKVKELEDIKIKVKRQKF